MSSWNHGQDAKTAALGRAVADADSMGRNVPCKQAVVQEFVQQTSSSAPCSCLCGNARLLFSMNKTVERYAAMRADPHHCHNHYTVLSKSRD